MHASNPQTEVTAPCRWLDEQDRLVGPVLDWWCGNGSDVKYIRNAYGYDPVHSPELPKPGELFNTVLCTYVLNSIHGYFDRCILLKDAFAYLAEGGWLYVSIHRDDTTLLTDTTDEQKKQEYISRQLRLGDFTFLRSTGDTEIWGWQRPTAKKTSSFYCPECERPAGSKHHPSCSKTTML